MLAITSQAEVTYVHRSLLVSVTAANRAELTNRVGSVDIKGRHGSAKLTQIAFMSNFDIWVHLLGYNLENRKNELLCHVEHSCYVGASLGYRTESM